MDFLKNELNDQLVQLKQLVSQPRQVCAAFFVRQLPPQPCSVSAAQAAFQMLNLAMVVLSALIIWKSAMVYTISESPVVVVLRYVLCAHIRGLRCSLTPRALQR